MLLFSGATPAAPGRLERLDAWLPLGVIEVSHFIGSVVGAVLLVAVAGPGAAARRRVLPGVGGDRRRHRRVAAEGPRLRGSDPPAFVLLVLVRARPAFDRRAAFFETRFSAAWVAAVARRARRVGLARAVRLQARRLSQRAVVAVRAARRGVAVPARVGRRRRRRAAVRRRPAGRPAPHEVVEPSDADLRRRRRDHRRAADDVGEPRLPARQGAAVQRRPHRLRDVRRAGADLGGARRSGRTGRSGAATDPPVPRALRRLRRHAGLLRGRDRRTCIATPTSG